MTTPDPDTPRRGATRRRRFHRSDPPPLRLTENDIAVLRAVARNRFLRSTHLTRLFDRPPKKLVERLGALYHAGYLDRPRQQLERYLGPGSAPMVYALGNAGARVLAELDHVPLAKVDWTDKNREAGRPFIEHALLVADLMIALEVALRAHPEVRFVGPHEILARAPIATQRAQNPWLWSTKIPSSGQLIDVGLVPDKVFGLDFTVQHKRSYFFLEADRSTMPIVRSNLRQTSFQRKLLAYWHGHRARLHTHRYAIGNFRVLTLARSPVRIASMIAAVKEITDGRGSNLFLFTDTATIANAPDMLLLPWTSGTDIATTLVP